MRKQYPPAFPEGNEGGIKEWYRVKRNVPGKETDDRG